MQIKDGQVYALNSLITGLMDRDDRGMKLYIVSQLLDKEVETTKKLEVKDWQEIRDEAYPDWTTGDWEACQKFRMKVKDLRDNYLEKELGYQKLI